MKFCSECGGAVALQPVPDDSRERFVCSGCGKTHYQNPCVLVATYVCCGEKILWLKRGIAPAAGKWALPGGFMENQETPEAAASRELREETGVDIDPAEMLLVSVSSILNMAQTHLVFRCHVDTLPVTRTTVEASAVGWFTENDLPWQDMAFPSIEPHVRQIYRWLRKGSYGIRVGFIDRSGSQYRIYPLADC